MGELDCSLDNWVGLSLDNIYLIHSESHLALTKLPSLLDRQVEKWA